MNQPPRHEKQTKFEDINFRNKLGEQVTIRARLIGKGNLVDGGTCWLVPSQEVYDDESQRVELIPDTMFVELMKNLEAFGGGKYVLSYDVTVVGIVHQHAAETFTVEPQRIIAKTRDSDVDIELS